MSSWSQGGRYRGGQGGTVEWYEVGSGGMRGRGSHEGEGVSVGSGAKEGGQGGMKGV